MSEFKCNACGAEFSSTADRPPCPQGCRYPLERHTAYGDGVTTERVGRDPQATMRAVEEAIESTFVPESPPKPHKRKPGRPKKRRA